MADSSALEKPKVKPNLTAFGDLLSSLKQVVSEEQDPVLKEKAYKLLSELKNPVASLYAVNQYLSFVTGPLSPSSSLALALHQWAFMLLCLRFEQIGKEIKNFLKERIKGNPEALHSEISQNLAVKSDPARTKSLLEATLSQVERLKDECHVVSNMPMPKFVPLPPSFSGGRDGALYFKREDQKERTWHLKFCFDLENLGPLEIRAEAKFPEIKLAFTAPYPKTLQMVRTLLPTLREKLQEIGVTTTSSFLKEAQVSFDEDKRKITLTPEEGFSVTV